MKHFESAGYIVVDGDLIWGSGPTAQAAWENFLSEMDMANITVRGEIDDSGDPLEYDAAGFPEPDQTPANRYKITAATKALLDQVESCGGRIAWRQRGVVACTVDEYDAE